MEHEVLVALRLGIVGVGGLLAFFALRVGGRAGADRRPYLLLAVGFGLVTLAAVVEGALFELAAWDMVSAATAEALFSAVGFALILWAVWISGVGAGNPPVGPPST